MELKCKYAYTIKLIVICKLINTVAFFTLRIM